MRLSGQHPRLAVVVDLKRWTTIRLEGSNDLIVCPEENLSLILLRAEWSGEGLRDPEHISWPQYTQRLFPLSIQHVRTLSPSCLLSDLNSHRLTNIMSTSRGTQPPPCPSISQMGVTLLANTQQKPDVTNIIRQVLPPTFNDTTACFTCHQSATGEGTKQVAKHGYLDGMSKA
jgi:hypothetical protein